MARSRDFHHVLTSSTNLVGSPEGALPFLAPTRAKLIHHHAHESFTWTARDHRKQRHLTVSPRSGRGRHTASPWARIAKMTEFEYWNVSWWVAVLFTVGSVVWVVNGFISFLPFVTSTSKDPVGGGWSAWVGATIFEAGSILLILEAWNRDDVAGFGHAIEDVLKGERTQVLDKSDRAINDDSQETLKSRPKWKWWSTDPKYWHELGFVAGFAQLLGASIFWISGFTALPEIQNALSTNPAALDGIFWTPQVVGGMGFIVSSTLYMLETQKTWYIPAVSSLGWQIGFWNFIGAIGFTLCGALGYSTNSGAMYQSALATFWGSWAFLIGSVIQWYEAVNPVSVPG